RKRQAAPGGNAGERKRGRRHHSKYSNDPFGARATARPCAETFGGARRSLHGQTRLRKIKRRKAQGQSAAVCKPAQRSRRLTQAIGSGDRGEAPPWCCVVRNWGDRGSGRRRSLGNFSAAQEAGTACQRALVGGRVSQKNSGCDSRAGRHPPQVRLPNRRRGGESEF